MNYNIKDDLSLIKEFYKMSQDELAKRSGVDKITISRTENGESYPRTKSIGKIYDFCP